MRNSLFKTAATSLAALTTGVFLAATPVVAVERHSDGAHHVAHSNSWRVGDRHAGRRHYGGGYYGNGGYGNDGYYGGCDNHGYYDQGCASGPGIVNGIIGGAMGAVGGY